MKRMWLAALTMAAIGGTARGEDWPQWMGPQRDDVWRETGILEKFPKDGPKVLWREPCGYGYAGPAVADGKVYVPDFIPEKSDEFPKRINNPFNNKEPIAGKERLVCRDAKTGKEIWTKEYDCEYKVQYPGGPRCTPTVHDGKVYTVGAMGNLTCWDATSGSVLWSKDFKKDYGAKTAQWGFAGHPLIIGDKLICAVGGNKATVVAFDRNTGKELWKSLNASQLGYSSPALFEA